MAKALLSSSLLPSLTRATVAGGALRLPPLPSLSRSGCRRAAGCRVRASLPGLDSVGGLHAALERAEAALYTLADAAVVAGAGGAGAGGDVEQAVQKSGGWFGFISNAMEVVLKVLLIGALCGVEIEAAHPLHTRRVQPRIRVHQRRL